MIMTINRRIVMLTMTITTKLIVVTVMTWWLKKERKGGFLSFLTKVMGKNKTKKEGFSSVISCS